MGLDGGAWEATCLSGSLSRRGCWPGLGQASSRQHSTAVVRVGGAHLTSQLLPISSWFLSGVHFLEVEMGLISACPGL